jgi:hypothetical protein
MSTTPAVETTTEPTETSLSPDEPTTEPERTSSLTEHEGEHPSREAASYRRRLREVEAERDTLRERIDGYERREVEALARELGAAVPSDVWTLLALDELRSDGVLDVDNTRSRISAILSERPTWRAARPDLGAGAREHVPEPRQPGLSDLFAGKRR